MVRTDIIKNSYWQNH